MMEFYGKMIFYKIGKMLKLSISVKGFSFCGKALDFLLVLC
jgi:hypothetical protein